MFIRDAILYLMELKTYCEQHGQTTLANLLGVTQGAVWQWLNGYQRITAERAIEIERVTQGAVSKHELRPDVFGPKSDGDKHG